MPSPRDYRSILLKMASPPTKITTGGSDANDYVTYPKKVLTKVENQRRRASAGPSLLYRARRSSESAAEITRSSTYPDISRPSGLMLASTLPSTIQRSQSLSGQRKLASLATSPVLQVPDGSTIPSDPTASSQSPSSISFLDLFVGKGLSKAHASAATLEPSHHPEPSTSAPSSFTTSTNSLLTMPALSSPTTWWSSLTGTPSSLITNDINTKEREEEEGGDKTDPADQFLDKKDQAPAGEPVWARLKDRYEKPKYPMVFCHGLFGFDKVALYSLPAGVFYMGLMKEISGRTSSCTVTPDFILERSEGSIGSSRCRSSHHSSPCFSKHRRTREDTVRGHQQNHVRKGGQPRGPLHGKLYLAIQ